ncbi:MAG: hypothetical protein C0613_12200 [Desulfobulbaceae bacterium]|nr:MAG: hypothetical protein C0613_12200 [Desulfobulbaceae bacterium]
MSNQPIQKDKMKKVLRWLSENVAAHPDKRRIELLREAEIRFDLSPRECCFLDENFSHSLGEKSD